VSTIYLRAGVDFDSVNVLDYPLIREGVKVYGWVPQDGVPPQHDVVPVANRC
jgi:hypothetical protein